MILIVKRKLQVQNPVQRSLMVQYITGADLASSARRGAGFPWGGA